MLAPPTATTSETPRNDGAFERVVQYVRSHLPRGRALPKDVWERQHQAILVLLWLHAVGILLYGLIAENGLVNSAIEAALVGAFAFLAGSIHGARRVRGALATLGLLTSSFVLVHFSGGFVEMHFHFLLMMLIVSLYEDWVPFLLAIGYILAEYLIVGIVEPSVFYARGDGWAEPWTWLVVHAAFVVAACIAGLVHWRLDESAHARADLILDSAGEGIFGVDPAGRITFVNPAAARMLGYRSAELIGRSVSAIVPHEPDNGWTHVASARAIERTLKEGATNHCPDTSFRRRDGACFPVEFDSTPIYDAGDVVGAVVAFDDIAERKQAEAERARLVQEQIARARAEEATRARDELMSVVSHDLKNPLGAMKGYAQLARRRLSPSATARDERTVEGLAKIDATATKMTALIDELLDVVRLQMGEQLDLDCRSVDLVALARRVGAEYQGLTEHHLIRVLASVPRLVGTWDEGRLERVLRNLLENAIKYSSDGEIILAVERDARQPNRWAAVRVRDQGVGIPAADLPFIFERFRRVRRKVDGRIEGTGIGLASARSIVEQHGGTIAVESQEGVGSTFTVRLPISATITAN